MAEVDAPQARKFWAPMTKIRDGSRLWGGHLAKVSRGSRPLFVWTLLYSTAELEGTRIRGWSGDYVIQMM